MPEDNLENYNGLYERLLDKSFSDKFYNTDLKSKEVPGKIFESYLGELIKNLTEIKNSTYNKKGDLTLRGKDESYPKRFFNGGDNDDEPLFSLDAYLSCVARHAYRIARDSQYPGNSKAGDRIKDAQAWLDYLKWLAQVLGIPLDQVEDAINQGKGRIKGLPQPRLEPLDDEPKISDKKSLI